MGKVFFGFLMTALLAVSTSCSAGKLEKKSFAIGESWKLHEGDNSAWAAASLNEGDWQVRDSLASVPFKKVGNYFWVRSEVSIPSELRNEPVWLGMKKFNAAVDVYADGVYIGTRGNFPPATNIKIEKEVDFLIPESCIHNNKVQLAMRFYLPGDCLTNPDFHLDNSDMAFYQSTFKSIFNQKLFLMLGVVSVFFVFYSLMQYVVDTHDKSYLYFIVSVIFVTIYFMDLGSDSQWFSYNLQRSLCRCCLGIGMSTLIMFLNTFFKRKHYKIMLSACCVTAAALLIAFLSVTGHDSTVENLFLIGLVVVVVSIVYGFICTIQSIKQGNKEVIPILVGFALGTLIALHDIVYQIIGQIPFMWIQGIAFFVLDLGIFLTLAIRQFNSKQEAVALAIQTEKQKETLSSIIDKAQQLANDSNNIAQELSESVEAVVQASDQTQDKIREINTAIEVQNRVREETDVAVNNLINFLQNISRGFDEETRIINSTVSQTQEVIKGISQVGDGITSAAEFTSSLSKLTKEGTDDTKALITVSQQIQGSSEEILGVVTTLDNFAHKIDLLSMNASIEAAHSGEAGKGFAVIAHEIKNLARQTQQWSSKIGEIISSVMESISESSRITTKVNEALIKINEGSSLSAEKVNFAVNGVKTQQEAGSVISRESRSLYESASQMQKEVNEQSVFSGQVLENMKSLQEASTSVDTASVGISKEAQQLAVEAEKLKALAQRTSDSAIELLRLMKE